LNTHTHTHTQTQTQTHTQTHTLFRFDKAALWCFGQQPKCGRLREVTKRCELRRSELAAPSINRSWGRISREASPSLRPRNYTINRLYLEIEDESHFATISSEITRLVTNNIFKEQLHIRTWQYFIRHFDLWCQ